MQETRRKRLASAIQEEISTVVSRELKDPRIPLVTFTAVDVTEDGDQATVFVSILGGPQAKLDGTPLSESAAKLRMLDCLQGLSSAAPYLRRHLARVLSVRHIPVLVFREDKGFENATRVHELLKQIESTTPKSLETEDDEKESSGA